MGQASSQQFRVTEPVKKSSMSSKQVVQKATPGKFKRQMSRRSFKRKSVWKKPPSAPLTISSYRGPPATSVLVRHDSDSYATIPHKTATLPLPKVHNVTGYESGCRTLPREPRDSKALGTKSVSFSNLTQVVRSPTLYSDSTGYSTFVPPSFDKSFVRYKSPNPGTLERRYRTKGDQEYTDHLERGRWYNISTKSCPYTKTLMK